MAPRKPTGPTAGFDLEEMFRPFASMAPDWSKAMPAMGASRRIWAPSTATTAARTTSEPTMMGRRPMRSDSSPAQALARAWPRLATSARAP